MINDFIHTYKSTILGKYDPKRIVGQNKGELSGGAKIKAGYWNLYEEEAKSDYKACAEYSDMHIQKAIQMHEGDGLPGFPGVDVFTYLITP